MKIHRAHVLPHILISAIGVIVAMFFSDNVVGLLGGFVLIVYGTAMTVFHLTVDEHIQL